VTKIHTLFRRYISDQILLRGRTELMQVFVKVGIIEFLLYMNNVFAYKIEIGYNVIEGPE